MIATSIERARKLLKLGLDSKTADMVWTISNSDLPMLLAYPIEDCNSWEDKIPAWSLSALLEVIPKECEPDIQKSPINGVYFAHWFAGGKPYITDYYGNAVTAAYEMVCWLLENNFIKKGDDNE